MRTTTPLALAALLAALALMGATTPARAAKEEPPVPMDASFNPAERAGELVSNSAPQHLKGIQRVAVSQFSVEFIVSDTVTAQTSGFAAAGRASTTATYKLLGVGEPDFQALTEAFHAAFVKDLQASGLEVLPAAQLAASPIWAKLVAGGKPLPLRSDTAVTVGLPGGALWGVGLAGASTQSSGGGGLFGAISAIGGVASAIGQQGESIELQKELGGVALLEVSLRVHFAQLTNNNRGFLGRMASQASVTGKVFPSVQQGRLMVHNNGAIVNLSVKAPLALDPAAFADLREAQKTTGEVATAVGVGLLRMAIGNRDSSSSQGYEAVADPGRWREVVGTGLGQAGQLLIASLKAAR